VGRSYSFIFLTSDSFLDVTDSLLRLLNLV
jgi:hypothetical protein